LPLGGQFVNAVVVGDWKTRVQVCEGVWRWWT